jgi:cholesterol transport system auxiliary component
MRIPQSAPVLRRRPGVRAAAPVAAGRWLAIGAVVLLQACTILPKAEPLDVYLLPSTASVATSAAQAVPWSLRIARPAAGVHLSGQRIVVVPEGSRVSVYKGAGWSDPAPVLVRNRLLDAFRADGRVFALSTDDKQLQADFELDSELRAFQSEYRDGRPQVVVRLDARLVDTGSRHIVASRSFELRMAASSPAVPAVVQAFGAASDQLAAEVVDWTLSADAAAR